MQFKNFFKKYILLILMMATVIKVNAQSSSPYEQIKNWGDSIFDFYETAKLSNENTSLKYVPLEDIYNKLDSNDVVKLFSHFNNTFLETNHLKRLERFRMFVKLYNVTNSTKLGVQLLETLFLPQYWELLNYQYFLSNSNYKIYTDEISPNCKQQIIDFLNEKMQDSIAEKIVYNKIIYSQKSYIESIKKLYPTKYNKPLDELLDSVGKVNLKLNIEMYKKRVFDEDATVTIVCKIVGDKFWKELSPLLEKKYLNGLSRKDSPHSYVQIVEVLSRFNYKNYKEEYYNQSKRYLDKIIQPANASLCYDGQNTLGFILNTYSENYKCFNLVIEKIYKDSEKKYLCPDRRFLAKGAKQDTMNWANDYIESFKQAFPIDINPFNWKRFYLQNKAVFNKEEADEIKKWLSKFTQATFPYKKYKGYYKFPKSR